MVHAKLRKMLSLVLAGTVVLGMAGTNGLEVHAEAESGTLSGFGDDFESYTSATDFSTIVGGWGSRTISLTDNEETTLNGINIGQHSLSVTERDSSSVLVYPGIEKYEGYKVKLSYDVKAAADVKFTGVVQNEGSDNPYMWVATIDTTGEWQHAEAEFDVPKEPQNLYFQTADGSYNGTANEFVIDNIKLEVVGAPEPEGEVTYVDTSSYEDLAELYKDYFKLGVACEAIDHWNQPNKEIGNPNKEALMTQAFNSITFGNELKPAYNLNKTGDGTSLFKVDPAAEEMLDWAKTNDVGVRAHVLVWHSQVDPSFFAKDFKATVNGTETTDETKTLDADCLVDRDTLLARMQNYIDGAMKYLYENGYAKTVYAWDVVNEASDESQPDGLRNSYWKQIIGSDYLYYAFLYAREAEVKYAAQYAAAYNLNAAGDLSSIMPKLFYNDYNEWMSRSDDIVNFLTKEKWNENHEKVSSPVIKANGDGTIYGDGLIDGIGMQGHVKDDQDIDSYMTALEKYNEAVGEVHITELDVECTSKGENRYYYQAKFYYDFFQRLKAEVRDKNVNLTSVTIWGLTDDASWRSSGNPLLFNKDLSKKAAFDAMVWAGNGQGFALEPARVKVDFSDKTEDFEDKDGNAATAESTGMTVRGAGTLAITDADKKDGKKSIVISDRTATWNGMSFAVERFAGQEIEISAWVKCADDEVKLSADISDLWPNIAKTDTQNGEWNYIHGKYKVQYGTTGLNLYFESAGTSDIYVDNLSVHYVGLREDYEDKAYNGAARGAGHQPTLSVVETENHTADVEEGKALKVTRSDQSANMKFDVSAFIGKTIEVSAFVKTSDTKIRMGLDTSTPVQLAEVAGSDGWNKVSTKVAIPENLSSAYIYLETDGKADMYVDDITAVYTTIEPEQKPETKPDNKPETTPAEEQKTQTDWAAAVEEVKKAEATATVTVKVDETGAVSKNMFSEIKGTDKTVVLDMGNGIKWTINGKDVKNVPEKDLNLKITLDSKNIPENVLKDSDLAKKDVEKTIQMSLADNSNFGFTAAVTIPVGKEFAGKYANLYYFNPTSKKMEGQMSSLVDQDGNATFTLTHASDYAISITAKAALTTSPDTGDVNNVGAYVLILIMGAVLLGVMKIRKKVRIVK